MSTILKTIVVILTIGISFAADGVINVGNANVIPAPLDIVEDNGVGTFSFNIYESDGLDISLAGSPIQITISLANIDVIDGINSVHGYEPYFDIAISYPSGVPNVYLQQKAVIPANSNIPLSIDVKVTANTPITTPYNGGVANLTPGSGQPTGGVSSTSSFTYTVDLPYSAADPYSLSIDAASSLIEVGESVITTFEIGNNGSDPIPAGGATWNLAFPNIVSVNQASLNLDGADAIFTPAWVIDSGVTNLKLNVVGAGLPVGPQSYTMTVELIGAILGGPAQQTLDNSYNSAISQNSNYNNDTASGYIEVNVKVSCVSGSIIYNTETGKFNFCENGYWAAK